MDIHIGIVNQRLKLRTNVKSIATDNRKFIRFVFDLPNDWEGLEVEAQFSQDDSKYKYTLDSKNSVYFPSEITEGEFSLGIRGTGNDVIATTSPITMYACDPSKE